MKTLVRYKNLKNQKMYKKKIIILCILFTNNNILCTFTNLKGQTLLWNNVGSEKVKGIKKITVTSILTSLKIFSLNNKNLFNFLIYVKIKGFNKNKNYFIKILKTLGFNLLFLQDNINIAYNGCKNKRTRKF